MPLEHPCAPHISQTPCSGCHGTSFSWQTMGESDVHHFYAETAKNLREIPHSFPSCHVRGGSTYITQSLHRESYPGEAPSAHWTRSTTKK